MVDDVVLKRFEKPDETLTFEKGKFEIVHVGGMTIGRASYEPGWRWSEHIGKAKRREALHGRTCARSRCPIAFRSSSPEKCASSVNVPRATLEFSGTASKAKPDKNKPGPHPEPFSCAMLPLVSTSKTIRGARLS